MAQPVNQDSPLRVYSRWRHAGLHLWLERAARQLLPPICLVCAERGEDGLDLCRACHRALPVHRDGCRSCALPLPVPPAQGPEAGRNRDAGTGGALAPAQCGACLRRQRPPPLDAVHAAFVYAPPLDRLLPRFKFQHDLAAGRLLARLMADAFATAEPPQALLPVPLHRGRLRCRGYDQALELARALARQLQLPLHPGALRRIRATAAQSELDAAARRRNLRGAFQVAGGIPLPAHVALVDDVMTTGATLHAAAAALRRAGVERVDAWVCARVP